MNEMGGGEKFHGAGSTYPGGTKEDIGDGQGAPTSVLGEPFVGVWTGMNKIKEEKVDQLGGRY